MRLQLLHDGEILDLAFELKPRFLWNKCTKNATPIRQPNLAICPFLLHSIAVHLLANFQTTRDHMTLSCVSDPTEWSSMPSN